MFRKVSAGGQDGISYDMRYCVESQRKAFDSNVIDISER